MFAVIIILFLFFWWCVSVLLYIQLEAVLGGNFFWCWKLYRWCFTLHFQHLMYNEGEVTRVGDLVDLRSGKLSRIFKKLRLLALGPSNAEAAPQDNLLLTALVKDKSSEVIQYLSERHWTSSCIVTMKRFEDICGGSDEALAVFNHLWGCGKSCHLYTHKEEVLEGVKISLSSDAVSGITSLDYDILHLVWTTEKLQQQLNVIDLRYQKSRSLAVASLKSGDRRAALRYARELKLARESREKCDSLMNRVEEVLNVILDAESTRKVFEAIQIGARAMKENNISVEEVKLCLDEIDECIESQKQVENAIESASSTGFEEEDLEEEFRKWELEIRGENPEMGSGKGTTLEEPDSSGLVESLSNRLGNLRLEVDQTDERVKNESETSMGISNRLSTHLLKPEAA
ncbi:hypothetical protein SAY86_010803 [Trapa natans]|uniref:Charged multivesicular body protein 7 n=1 Tax=Trapa natans TaxID=22666 RepID=A0AAN7LSV4_TRANT|nr:hypothetical protein SAY86_010803 [Trapa natans]